MRTLTLLTEELITVPRNDGGTMQEAILESYEGENPHPTTHAVSLEAAPQPAFHAGASFEGSLRWSGLVTALDSPSTVLLAEDDDDLRYVMGQILESMGFCVIPCCDAQHASAVFRARTDVGLLLTDLQMPGRSGVELAREVTALRPSLPVLIMSGSVRSADLIRKMRFRKWKFLRKPFEVAALTDAVHLLLPVFQRVA